MKSRENNVPAITVYNRQRAVRADLSSLNEFAGAAVKLVALARVPGDRSRNLPDEIAVVLVSDRRMAELHRRFMNLPGPTDVITFQHGEIFISTETAHSNAQRFRTPLHRELALYLVHGLLHLRGFDDRAPAAAKRMQVTQERIMERLQKDNPAV